ncbi:MAG: NAD(P)-dependent oxidoreductase [Planctomycetes bacterium]|nr:NAD(P)-dependent oxidoreductase [Planctomycetota bacterium]
MLAITGATGFVGSHLVEQLKSKGEEFFCLVRANSKTRFLEQLGCKIVVSDFSQEKLEPILKQVDSIIHIAGVIKADSKNAFFKGNWMLTKNLVNASIKAGTKQFIYISSLSAAGSGQTLKKKTEEDPDIPGSWYGQSKLAAEREVTKHPHWVIIRPPVIFGPRDTGLLIIYKILSKGILPDFGGQRYYSMVFVEDLVNFVINVISNHNIKNDRFFVCYDEYFSFRKLCSKISNILDVKPKSIYQPKIALDFITTWNIMGDSMFNQDKLRDLYKKFWICSNTRAKLAGILNKLTPFDEALSKTLNWYRKEGLI